MSCTVLTDKEVFTRKEHQCFMCLRKFSKGAKMHYQSNVYDDRVNSVYNCMTCQELTEFHNFQGDEFKYEEGCVDDLLSHHDSPENPEQLLMNLKEQECLNLEKTRLSQ